MFIFGKMKCSYEEERNIYIWKNDMSIFRRMKCLYTEVLSIYFQKNEVFIP